MSFIHEALRKAQKEKESRYREYHGMVSKSGYRPRFFSGKALWWTSFLLLSLAFMVYLWLPSRGTQPSIHEPARPVQPPQAERAVNVAVLYEKARVFQKGGRFQEAKQLYEKALNLDPNYVHALNNLGVINIRDKNYSGARALFAKAIQLQPGYVDAYYNVACLHALKGEVQQSLSYLKKAVSLNQAVKDWARTDSDLQNLHGAPGFELVLGSGGVME